jgi:hypothetical protein
MLYDSVPDGLRKLKVSAQCTYKCHTLLYFSKHMSHVLGLFLLKSVFDCYHLYGIGGVYAINFNVFHKTEVYATEPLKIY